MFPLSPENEYLYKCLEHLSHGYIEDSTEIIASQWSIFYLWECICAIISSVQLLSHAQLFVTPWTGARQASLSITNSWSLLKLMSIESVMPSNHLSSPSPPTFNLSLHQSLFQWVSSSHQVARVLAFQLQHQSVQWIFRTDFHPKGWSGGISLLFKGLSRVFSNTTVQRHQFFGAQLSL